MIDNSSYEISKWLELEIERLEQEWRRLYEKGDATNAQATLMAQSQLKIAKKDLDIALRITSQKESTPKVQVCSMVRDK